MKIAKIASLICTECHRGRTDLCESHGKLLGRVHGGQVVESQLSRWRRQHFDVAALIVVAVFLVFSVAALFVLVFGGSLTTPFIT